MTPLCIDLDKPLMIELYAGLHGWGEGGVAEGFWTVGFDIVDMCAELGVPRPKGCHLVIQDVMTLDGSQFRDAAVIVASPPCTEPSYIAMPWKRAKAEVPEVLPAWWKKPESKMSRAEYTEWCDWRLAHPREPQTFITLFQTCFRIQREASEAAGRHVPLIVENVKGAQRWIGKARAWFGSYYLWGDVGMVGKRVVAGLPRFGVSVAPMSSRKNDGGSWFAVAHNTESGHSRNPVNGQKLSEHLNIRDGHTHTRHLTNPSEHLKVPGIKLSEVGFNVVAAQRYREGVKFSQSGDAWFDGKPRDKMLGEKGPAAFGSKSDSRKAASAHIAKIPFPLAQHIARCFKVPTEVCA